MSLTEPKSPQPNNNLDNTAPNQNQNQNQQQIPNTTTTGTTTSTQNASSAEDLSKKKDSIFFPGLYQNYKYLISLLCTQFPVKGATKLDIVEHKEGSDQVIGVNLPPGTDLDEIIRNLTDLKILNPDLKGQYLDFKVCKFNDIKKSLESIGNKATKLIISAPRMLKNEAEQPDEKSPFNIDFVMEEVKEFLSARGIENHQPPFSATDGTTPIMVIDFNVQKLDEARKALEDLSCVFFYGTYLRVKLNDTQEEQGDKRKSLFSKLGNDGIRRDVRKEFGEFILNESLYDISQVSALTPKDNDQSKYNRLFGLLLVLFQFPDLKDPHFMIFVDSFIDRNNGCITGTIKISTKMTPVTELSILKDKVKRAFREISIMKLTGFCVFQKEDLSKGTAYYRFATSWCNKTSHSQ